MPIYEFRCPKCEKTFEVVRPRSASGKRAKCPDDGSFGQRLFSSAIIVGGSDDFDMGGFGDLGGMDDMGGMPGMGGGMPGMGGGMPGMDDMDF